MMLRIIKTHRASEGPAGFPHEAAAILLGEAGL